MAYRPSRRNHRRSYGRPVSRTRRQPARYAAPRRRRSVRRRAPASNTVRIVLVNEPSEAVARPELVGLKQRAPRKARF